MDSSGSQWAMFFDIGDNQGTSNTHRAQRTDSALVTIHGGGGTDVLAAYTSMDSDGFTLNFSLATGTASPVFSLALAGLDAKVGTFSKSTSGAPASQAVTGVGFAPTNLFLAGIQTTASNYDTHARLGFGASDGNSESSMALQDAHGQGSSSVDAVHKTSKAYVKVNNDTSSIDAEADLSSFDSDGFTLNWTTNDVANAQIAYLALAGEDTDDLRFAYDDNGDLVKVSNDESGKVTKFEYSNHRMTKIIDANNNDSLTAVYDSGNRVAKQIDAVGGITCVYYGAGPSNPETTDCPGVSPAADAGQTIVVDQRGKKTAYDFDTRFRTTSITDHDGGVTSFAYDASHNRVCVTDPRTHRTGITYDGSGNITGIIDAENTNSSCTLKMGGVKWTFTYTASNDIDLATDPLGRQTDYVYDVNANLTEIIRKDGSSNVKLWTCLTRPTSGADEGLVTEVIESTTLSNCTGNKTKLEYDSTGNIVGVIDPRFSGSGTPKSILAYDDRGVSSRLRTSSDTTLRSPTAD